MKNESETNIEEIPSFVAVCDKSSEKAGTLVWFVVRKDGAEYIASLSDIGAIAAHGPFLHYPVEIIEPASPEDIEWAEQQLSLRDEQEEEQAEYLFS